MFVSSVAIAFGPSFLVNLVAEADVDVVVLDVAGGGCATLVDVDCAADCVVDCDCDTCFFLLLFDTILPGIFSHG